MTNAFLIRLRLNGSCSARQKNMAPKKEKIEIRVTSEDKKQLKELAQAHAMSLSEYLRQAGLMQEITSRTEIEITLGLAKINANLARLGNMLKLAIDFEDMPEIKRLATDIFQFKKAVLKTLESIKLR